MKIGGLLIFVQIATCDGISNKLGWENCKMFPLVVTGFESGSYRMGADMLPLSHRCPHALHLFISILFFVRASLTRSI